MAGAASVAEELTRGPRFNGADQSENLGAAAGDGAISTNSATRVEATRKKTIATTPFRPGWPAMASKERLGPIREKSEQTWTPRQQAGGGLSATGDLANGRKMGAGAPGSTTIASPSPGPTPEGPFVDPQ